MSFEIYIFSGDDKNFNTRARSRIGQCQQSSIGQQWSQQADILAWSTAVRVQVENPGPESPKNLHPSSWKHVSGIFSSTCTLRLWYVHLVNVKCDY